MELFPWGVTGNDKKTGMMHQKKLIPVSPALSDVSGCTAGTRSLVKSDIDQLHNSNPRNVAHQPFATLTKQKTEKKNSLFRLFPVSSFSLL